MTELPEKPKEETEAKTREQPEDQGRHELHPEPTLDIPMIPEDPELIVEREGVHEIKLRSNSKTRSRRWRKK